MSTQLQFRRGNTSQTSSFTGAEAEVTVDTENKSLVVHDGVTTGGFETARVDLNNVENSTFAAKATAAGVAGGGVGGSITASVSSITQASPGVVTTTADHEFSNGQLITFTDVGGMTELNGESYYADVLTGNTFAIYSDAGLGTPLDTTGFGAYTSGGSVTAVTPPGAPVSASYIVISASPVLENERVLTAGRGIVLTDSGNGGAASIATDLADSVPINLGSAAAGIANSVSRSDHVHAMPTAADTGAVPNARTVTVGTGLAGGGNLSADISLSLSANLDNLTDANIANVQNGDALIYNGATSLWKNTQNLPRLTIQDEGVDVGTPNAVKTVSFAGDAVSDGQVTVVSDTDPTKVVVSIPEIFTQERVEDIAGNMVTSSNQNGIAVSYDDPSGKINFQVDEFDIDLTGDVQGSGTVTDLGNVTISVSIADNSVALGQSTVGNYVQSVSSSGNGISVSPGTAGEGSNVVLTVDSSSSNTGNTLVFRDTNGSFSANVVTASLSGAASLNVLKSGDTMTGALTLSGNPTSSLHAATKQYVDSSVDNATFSLSASAGSGSGALTNNDTLNLSGGSGISTSVSGSTFTINNSGVTSISAGSGISVSDSTGGITISATGVVAGVSSINSQTSAITVQGTSGEISVDVPASGIIKLGLPNSITAGSVSASSLVAGTLSSTNTIVATGNITGGNFVTSGTVSTTGIVKTGSNASGDIGQPNNRFNKLYATATSALYADLAELYLADQDYVPGTVVCFGGAAEISVTDIDADTAVAGVVSTDPAYEMNSGLTGQHVVKVALTGRVPCRVTGQVTKGALLVSAGNGFARAEKHPAPGTIVGKSLENFDGDSGVIEVAVGRF